MDQQTQPMQQPSTPPMATMPAEHKRVGPIVAILTIVLILVIGAIWLFASRMNKEQPTEDTNMVNNSMDTSASAEPETITPVTNTADDVDSINADLNASTKGLDGQNF